MSMRKLEAMCRMVHTSTAYTFAVILLLLFAVFGADARDCVATESWIVIFDILIFATMSILIFDICIRSVAEKTYFLSFYFWFDTLCTLLMLLEVSYLYIGAFATSVTSIGRAARLGIALGILGRLIAYGNPDTLPGCLLAIPTRARTLEGRLGYQTIVWVVFWSILFVYIAPVLSPGTYFDVYQDTVETWLADVDNAYTLYQNNCGSPTLKNSTHSFYQQQLLLYPKPAELVWIGYKGNLANCPGPQIDTTLPLPSFVSADFISLMASPWTNTCSGTSVVASDIVGVSLVPNQCPTDLPRIYRRSFSSGSFLVIIDTTEYVQQMAFLSIYRSLLIFIIVAGGVYLSFRAPYVLILDPIRKILSRINRVSEDPVSAATQVQPATPSPALVRYRKATNPFTKWYWKRHLEESNETAMEIAILERRVFQFANLLAVGFGAAGADIVRRNMTTSELGAIIPGSRVDGIFVHVRVENFQTITSVLQDKVVKFINIVTGIVHGIADEFHGTANKTDGETFLLVWELKENMESQIYDMVVTACVKICIAINRSLELREYRTFPPLMQKIPNFSVKLQFGIHKGWAIQGAIGSQLKIDPRYLSADVNTSELLERFNADLGTTILVSEEFVTCCSDDMKKIFRLVDKVKSKRGSVSVYSLDLDTRRDLDTPEPISGKGLTARERAVERAWRKNARWTSNIYDVLNSDNYFIKFREKFSPIFLDCFKKGLLNYLSGEWKTAKESFERIGLEIGIQDHPSFFILKYMQMHAFIAPENWDGYRPVPDHGDSLGYSN